jgi:hypothetical protein
MDAMNELGDLAKIANCASPPQSGGTAGGLLKRFEKPDRLAAMYSRLLVIVLLSGIAAATFAAYFVQIVNDFYVWGAYFLDAGWTASLMSRFEFPLSNPPLIQESGIPSYFSVHLALIMPLWGALSEVAGLSPGFALASFEGLFHALLFLVGAGLADNRLSQPWSLLLRLFCGVALAFSPVCLEAIGYPKTELAIPILFITTCYALSRDRLFLAFISFALMLSVREDAGFHAFCFLSAYALGELIAFRFISRSARIAITLAAIGFLYSCMAFGVISWFFPQFQLFTGNYSGHSFFNHLSLSLYRDRLYGLLQKRPELFVILFMPVAIGALQLDLTIVLGVGAILPWVVLNLSAIRGPPSELFAYYAFPFLILLAWPWLVYALRQLDTPKERRPRRLMPGQGAVLWSILWVVAVVVYFTTPFAKDPGVRTARAISVQNFLPSFDRTRIQLVNTFANTFAPLLESPNARVWMDDAMFSLLPDKARGENSLEEKKSSEEKNRFAEDQPYIVAYFASYMQADGIVESDFASKADACFAVVGTNIRLLSSQASEVLRQSVGSLIKPVDCLRLREGIDFP